MNRTTERLSELPITDIASMVDSLYRAFDDIQGFLSEATGFNGTDDCLILQAREKALRMMQNMEDDLV